MSGDNLHGKQPLKFYSTELTSTKLLLVNTMKLKTTENYEQLLQRFTKRTMQLSARNAELKSAYEEYVKNESDLWEVKPLRRASVKVKSKHTHHSSHF